MYDLLKFIGFFVLLWVGSYAIILSFYTLMGTFGVVVGPWSVSD